MQVLSLKSLKLSGARKLTFALVGVLLVNSYITSATAADIGVTVTVQENRNPADDCVPTAADWSPNSMAGPNIFATPGVAEAFQINPNFVDGSGFVDGICGTSIAPTGVVQASIALTDNPAGWTSSVDCTDTCPASDFIDDQQGINFIDASVTPPNVFGDAYDQGVVVTVTWTP
jgi:hypothetical protein